MYIISYILLICNYSSKIYIYPNRHSSHGPRARGFSVGNFIKMKSISQFLSFAAISCSHFAGIVSLVSERYTYRNISKSFSYHDAGDMPDPMHRSFLPFRRARPDCQRTRFLFSDKNSPQWLNNSGRECYSYLVCDMQTPF